MSKCKDILLVKAGDGSPVLVEAPSHMIYPGTLVTYDGGKYGIVQQRAFISDTNDLLDIFSAIAPVFELEEAFASMWKQKETEDVTGSP